MNRILGSFLILLLLSVPMLAQPARPAANDQSDRPKIDVQSYSVDVTIVPEEHRLVGKADISFKQLDRNSYATFDIDRRLRVSTATVGGQETRFRQFDLDSTVEIDLSNSRFGSGDPVVHIEYEGILDPEEDRRDPVLAKISEDSAFLLYEGKWFPTNGLFSDKAEMKLNVTAPPDWKLVTDLPRAGSGFASSQPAFWGMVAAGKYTPVDVKGEKSEVTVQTLKAPAEVATPIAEAAGKIMDYYTETFGPPPSSKLSIVEVQGANWPSRWAVGTLLLPSNQLKKDFELPDLAVAVAHQWFPLKIGVKDQGADAWLVDGMSVFASLMYFEKTLSPADAQEHINKALVRALGYEGNTSIRQAGNLEKDSPEYRSLVQYKGAYVLRMLRWVMGDENFQKLLSAYLDKYQNTPASTEEFEKMASSVAGGDLNYFFDQWLNSSGVPELKQEYTVFRTKDGYKIVGQIRQDLDLFRMPVELQIQTDGDPEYARVDVQGEASDFDVLVQRKPKAVVIDPREKLLRMSPDIRISVLVNRGEDLVAEGKYNEAIDQYQKAIDIDSHNSIALFRMGEALFELGNLQAAANVFRESLNGDLKPKWVEVWAYVNLGKIFDIRGQRERAVTEYQKAVNTGDDAYGAQAEAQKYIGEPFRRSGRTTIG
jgi:peptidase M1-like protein/tetratricopeptide repeat protein